MPSIVATIKFLFCLSLSFSSSCLSSVFLGNWVSIVSARLVKLFGYLFGYFYPLTIEPDYSNFQEVLICMQALLRMGRYSSPIMTSLF